MDNYIRSLDMQAIVSAKVEADSFIEMYNKGEAILLDVRYGFEHKVWGLSFTCNIPLNELPDRLGELPKDKIIVCACPEACRSNIAKQYLSLKGFNAKILTCGMITLMERLKGGKAKDLHLEV
ncbi:MAG: rhodanese-like domain-containing protein [Epsilonproteobacteria bacterium]|jgi:rhodanese-related sulfurtransferase|uniref:Sulfurtransferase n=1 Tax=Sulfurospirillum cavolei TaxID=366522 RepID=A0A2D3W8C7_9BACT|nr:MULTISPECIES: rhodanese-like domain-containing protein [unclassified Sulfurospirillum]MCD8544990.1 rhodanese-like domain-containing protein [Sulfurospirillum cavolei]NCB53565.1 rhodanese-like domain-containing protein [Campylobacterota bacterium]KHG33221.1 MAG: sulfurtransferase [Sulfurospirillum sp. MES]MCP3652975.1 rhodanese-like domain-containing protein [Sulfurospirillum sp. DNRA8]MCR1811826.1 rhodanese-like domain-containing protein [Sulfurospirillum sp. DNRA8]